MARKFGSALGFAVLNAVADGIEIIENSCYRPNALMRYGLEGLKSLDAERARNRMGATVRRLKSQRLIKERRQNEKRAFFLTRLGKEMLRIQSEFPTKFRSSGERTLVSFDIPEAHKNSREVFRAALRRMGFIFLHKSVWISPQDWTGVLNSYITRHDLKNWVYVFTTQTKNKKKE